MEEPPNTFQNIKKWVERCVNQTIIVMYWRVILGWLLFPFLAGVSEIKLFIGLSTPAHIVMGFIYFMIDSTIITMSVSDIHHELPFLISYPLIGSSNLLFHRCIFWPIVPKFLIISLPFLVGVRDQIICWSKYAPNTSTHIIMRFIYFTTDFTMVTISVSGIHPELSFFN